MEESRRTEEQKLMMKKTYLSRRNVEYTSFTVDQINEAYRTMRRASRVERGSDLKGNETKKQKQFELSPAELREQKKRRQLDHIKGMKTYLRRHDIDIEGLDASGISKRYYEELAPLQQKGRGSTEQEVVESYRKAIITKGLHAGEKYGIDTSSMTPEEISLLSGMTKKLTHSNRSAEDRRIASRRWKETHILAFFKSETAELRLMSDNEISDKFREYMFLSGRLETIANNSLKVSSKYKSSWVSYKEKKLFCRSSYESRFVDLATQIPFITDVEGNQKGIRYDFNGESRYYFPDFMLTLESGIRILVEIKAEWMMQDEKTLAKFNAGRSFAQQQNIEWAVIREARLKNSDTLREELGL